MDADFPQSAFEAQEHIRAIRRDKGLGDGPERIGDNAADLESALQILSKDLYQTPTHFLLELIQNADDNYYTADVPTLSISYSENQLRVDCNERGFTRKNVEAICRICQSTKSGRSKSAGFVGEKGIGFKAVFKVARRVWISSGHYSFRFDRDAHLGMIAPIWDAFPAARRAGYTSLLLDLAADCDHDRIIDELGSYDERTLLFLRRLRTLEIVQPVMFSLQYPLKTVLSRQGGSSDTASEMVLMRHGEEKHYFVYRQEAGNLPKEDRRPGISSSEIVIAFPHTGFDGDQHAEPVIESQNIYSFLPIRDAGFKFLLQGDFLLSANREDIHDHTPWNAALAWAAAFAFLKAVLYLGTLDNSLRYSWVQYIPSAPAKTTFCDVLRRDIIDRLKRSKVLETESGTKRKPSDIIRVPAKFRDPAGRPYTMRYKNGDKYLAGAHDKSRADDLGLDDLSLKTMDERLFYIELCAALEGGPTLEGGPGDFFASRSQEWHSSFARILISTERPSRAPAPRVIPLKSGEWVSHGKDIFFPEGKLPVPEGIDVSLVDAEAAANPDRRELFSKMGVEELTDKRIRELLCLTHLSETFKPDQWEPEVLVSHAAFFFRASGNADFRDPVLIWMAADMGACRKSDAMYLPSNVASSASSLLPRAEGSDYGFLHPAYFQADVSNTALWLEFLRKRFQVSVYPRFFNPIYNSIGPAEVNLHDDFRYVMEELEPNTWLSVLRDGWSFYQAWIGGVTHDPLVSNYTHEAKTLVEWLSKEYKVSCTGSWGLVPLEDTYMPRDHLTAEYDIAPFVDVPDPQDLRWTPIMECFKIGGKADIKFHVSCLSGAKRNPKTSVEKIKQIMHQIEDTLEDKLIDLNPIRTRLNREKLIHIPPSEKGRENERGTWVSQTQCFWRGEPWLTQSFGLERRYPDLEVLFRQRLLVPNAGTDHYIREGRAIANLQQPMLSQVERIFVALTNQVKAHGLDTRQKSEIDALKIIPVAEPGGDFLSLVAASLEQPWLIADRENLREKFKSVLPLCMFGPAFVLRVKPLLLEIGLGGRFLSELVTSITEAKGDAELHEDLTEDYQKRRKYLFRLIPEKQVDQEHLRDKFSSVEVYIAPKIVQYWHAPLGLSQVSSTHSDGVAFLESDLEGAMRIYLRAGHEDEAHPYELAEQLGAFFNVAPEHRDLLAAAITAPEERVEQLFEARGIAPLIEDGDNDEVGGRNDISLSAVQFPPGPSHASRMRLGGDSRLTRLLSSTRFGPAFFNTKTAAPSLPPYDLALERSTHNAVGRPVEPRSFPPGVTVGGLNRALGRLEFVQRGDAVVGMPRVRRGLFERFRSWSQRSCDAGEAMVSDVLAVVLGPQYVKAEMWKTRRQRRQLDTAAFTFSDTQGKFSAFLMRLEGLPGGAQGYTRLVYHLDVKVSDSGSFELTQDEIERARKFSVHSQPNPAEQAPSKNVSILVHISDLRYEPRIRFLADPWDLFQDGQLELVTRTTYKAELKLRERGEGTLREAGFDAIQIRERDRNGDREVEGDSPPRYHDGKEDANGKGKGKE